MDRQTAVYGEEDEEVEGEQVRKERMYKRSQDGNKRGPETSGGEKPMHPEPLYKYHLRRGVDDGKRMETERWKEHREEDEKEGEIKPTGPLRKSQFKKAVTFLEIKNVVMCKNQILKRYPKCKKVRKKERQERQMGS